MNESVEAPLQREFQRGKYRPGLANLGFNLFTELDLTIFSSVQCICYLYLCQKRVLKLLFDMFCVGPFYPYWQEHARLCQTSKVYLLIEVAQIGLINRENIGEIITKKN